MIEVHNPKPKTQHPKHKKLKVFVTGTRGVPDIPGGVEKHCQELYPLVAGMGHEVFVAVRSSYRGAGGPGQWRGVDLVNVFAPRKKSFEAIVHTFLAVVRARRLKPDVVHIHAVGPGLMVPFAKLLGMRVVVTNHGPDYDREKWGKAARIMLRLGEYLGGRFADSVIVISDTIGGIVRRRCGVEPVLIPNGVPLPERSESEDYLEQIGAGRGRYLLAVSRFVPEKGLHLLVEAFGAMDVPAGYKLVIAGDADHENEYSRELKRRIDACENVVRTGYITGEPLNQVYSHAGLFVLPSFHEGLPIALLEAMSYGLPVLVSDIPANREVGLAEERYFKCGDVDDLREKLGLLLEKPLSVEEVEGFRREIAETYNWEKIARETVGVYEGILG